MSYRRSDVSGYSGRLTDALGARLGANNVFHDVTAISPGRDFQNEIDQSLAASDAVLAMIGPGWLPASTPQGDQRLFQDGDFVRSELSRALATNLPVVPVLVGGVTMPRIEDLPADLAELTRRQAVVLRDESFHADIDRLLRSLRGELDDPRRGWLRRRKSIMATSAVLFILITIGALTWLLGEQRSTGQTEPTGCPSTSSGNWHSMILAADPSAEMPYKDGGSLTFTVNTASWRQEKAGTWLIVLRTKMKNNAKADVYHDAWKYRNLRVALREFKLYCFDPPEDPIVRPGVIADARVGFNVTCPPGGQLSLLLEANNTKKELPFTKATTGESCQTSNP